MIMETNKAEIDTSAPFGSVKEAVILFGERIIASEVYANKLREMQNETIIQNNNGPLSKELQETKQNLQRAREETIQMAQYISTLQQELQQTKTELKRFIIGESKRHEKLLDLGSEDLKFDDDPKTLIEQVKTETITTSSRDQRLDVQKKKYVTFANPPSLTQMIVPQCSQNSEAAVQREPSIKKKKKREIIIKTIKGIFSKKNGSDQVAYA